MSIVKLRQKLKYFETLFPYHLHTIAKPRLMSVAAAVAECWCALGELWWNGWCCSCQCQEDKKCAARKRNLYLSLYFFFSSFSPFLFLFLHIAFWSWSFVLELYFPCFSSLHAFAVFSINMLLLLLFFCCSCCYCCCCCSCSCFCRWCRSVAALLARLLAWVSVSGSLDNQVMHK